MPTYEVKVVGKIVKTYTIDSDKFVNDLIDNGGWDENDIYIFDNDTAKDIAIDMLAEEYDFDLFEVLECKEII
jgi:hypothetical protein